MKILIIHVIPRPINAWSQLLNRMGNKTLIHIANSYCIILIIVSVHPHFYASNQHLMLCFRNWEDTERLSAKSQTSKPLSVQQSFYSYIKSLSWLMSSLNHMLVWKSISRPYILIKQLSYGHVLVFLKVMLLFWSSWSSHWAFISKLMKWTPQRWLF